MSGIRVPPMRSKNVAIVLKNSPIRLAFWMVFLNVFCDPRLCSSIRVMLIIF